MTRFLRLAFGLAFAGAIVATMIPAPSEAQNPMCPTRPASDNSNACASTAYVTTAVANAAAISGKVNSGTKGQIGYYAATGNTISGNSNVNISNGDLTLGAINTIGGSIGLFGATSGEIIIKPPAVSFNWTFTLPSTDGNSGEVLTTDGNGVTAWTVAGSGTISGTTGSIDNALLRADGTGGSTLQASPIIVADTTGALSRSGGGGIPIQGTNTNSSASAGFVGEVISSTVASGSAVGMPTTSTVNITSVSLTAGDWDCRGSLHTSGSAATDMRVGISATSATMPAFNNGNTDTALIVLGSGTMSTMVLPVGPTRILLSGTTTYFLTAQATYGSGTATGFGTLECRRMQ